MTRAALVVVAPSGRRIVVKRLRRGRVLRRNPAGPFAGARWVPLTHGRTEGGSYQWDAALSALGDASGVYVFRDRDSGEVIYVGESHTGRLYRTMLHHFHDPKGKFERLGEWVHHAPTRLDYKVFLASPAAVPELEKDAIEHFQPRINKLLVADADEAPGDDVPF